MQDSDSSFKMEESNESSISSGAEMSEESE